MSMMLSTSRHEINMDMELADPYSFPYFHQSNEVPDLFKAVNSFTFILSKKNVSHETQNRIASKLATKIMIRSNDQPKEIAWVDSCGENACHRFCESLRFRPGLDEDLPLSVLESLIEAEPRIAFTLNNWTETPLHQFVAHCGFEKDAIGTLTERIAQNVTDTNVEDAIQCGFPTAVKVIDLLLKAAPKSIFTVNYEKAIPLHEVCGLSRLNGEESIIELGSFLRDAKLEHAQQTCQEKQIQNDHIQIVQYLVQFYRKGLLFLDKKNKTPLYRAIESTDCSTEVVAYILEEMESIFSSQSHPLPVKAREDSKPILLRRAILGLNRNEWSEHGSLEEGRIASPLGYLWKVLLSPRKATDDDLAFLKNRYAMGEFFNYGKKRLSLSQLMILMSARNRSLFPLNRLGSIWTKSLVLMSSAYHGSMKATKSKDMSEWNLIHSAIFSSAPRSVIYTLAKIYPQELSKKDKEQMNNTPLSFAIGHWKSLDKAWAGYDRHEGIDTNRLFGEQHPFFHMNVVQLLLSLNKSPAVIHNSEGRFPLHLALAEGLGWSQGTSAIFSANPLAASLQDPATKLFPFIAAASAPVNNSKLVDHCQLSSIFTLLRADPSVIF